MEWAVPEETPDGPLERDQFIKTLDFDQQDETPETCETDELQNL